MERESLDEQLARVDQEVAKGRSSFLKLLKEVDRKILLNKETILHLKNHSAFSNLPPWAEEPREVSHHVISSDDGRREAGTTPAEVRPKLLSRSMLDPAALTKLHEVFRKTPTPTRERREELAREFNLPIKKVNNWFGGQRFRAKQTKAKATQQGEEGDFYHDDEERKPKDDASGEMEEEEEEDHPLWAALRVFTGEIHQEINKEEATESVKEVKQQQKTSGSSRSRLDPAAAAKFHEVFQETPKPSSERREELARKFNLPVKKVNNWFGSQRFNLKKKNAKENGRTMEENGDFALEMKENAILALKLAEANSGGI
jgi:hypothetical protein